MLKTKTASFAFAVAACVTAGSALLAASPTPVRQNAPAATPVAAAERFEVDGVHSKALFRVHHLGAGQFWGRFNDLSGSFTVNEGKPEGVSFDISIKTDSVDSGNAKLDAHLKTPDFFNAKEHPALTFKSTSVKAGAKPGWLEVTGDLTMNGVTKPVTATVEWTGTRSGQMGRRAGYEATFTIKRADWNINYMAQEGGLGEDVRIVVALEGTTKG